MNENGEFWYDVMQPLVNLCSAPIDGLTTLESGDPSQRNMGLFSE